MIQQGCDSRACCAVLCFAASSVPCTADSFEVVKFTQIYATSSADKQCGLDEDASLEQRTDTKHIVLLLQRQHQGAT